MDGSYTPEGEKGFWLNIRSRGRALLMLFLFSDVGPDDAPTRIKIGSHLDVPAFLAAAGAPGRNALALCQAMNEAGKLDAVDRPLGLATGQAGDVYLCHPFLIHAAQRHRGTVPRFIAQPPLDLAGLLELDRSDGAFSPVEIAVRAPSSPRASSNQSPSVNDHERATSRTYGSEGVENAYRALCRVPVTHQSAGPPDGPHR